MKALHPHGFRRGVLAITVAVACFAALDSSIKLLTGLMPLVMVVWSRYLVVVLITGSTQVLRRGGAALRTRHGWLQLARGLCLLLMAVLAFLSLRHMPVAEFTAVIMLTPLLITALAGRALGERVPLWRWVCVGLAFVGALMVIRPGIEDFNAHLLLPFALVAASAAYQLLTGRLARDEDVGTMQLYTGCVGLVFSSALLPWAWQTPPTPLAWALLGLIGLFGLLGHHWLIVAYQHAPASRLTPFLYLQIAFAMLLGWLLFGQVPDGWSWAGVVLIALAGAAGTLRQDPCPSA